jgi:uncharacterized protein with ParB-like and HNH nuclease domain
MSTEPEEPEDDLNVEEEIDEVPFVEYDISVAPSDPTLELLAQQIERGDIIIPPYQRRYVWKIEQASKLIESFLMGLPVPQVFLYVNADDQLEVIDGQQRLMSIKYFLEGFFGEEDDRGRRQTFKLKGLAQRSEYNGKMFSELSTKDQRKLRNSTLRAINIKQLKPSGSGDSVFHIFERLNTGGTQLKAQEIRNAVYRGRIVAALEQMNKNPNWRNILGMKGPDKNQRDIELILRLFSLYDRWKAYESPMLQYLNSFMNANRKFDSPEATQFQNRFAEAVNLVDSALEKPFRPRRVLNAAVLEAVLIAVMEDPSITAANLRSNYPSLIDDDEFKSKITGGTTDTTVLQKRIETAKVILKNGAI